MDNRSSSKRKRSRDADRVPSQQKDRERKSGHNRIHNRLADHRVITTDSSLLDDHATRCEEAEADYDLPNHQRDDASGNGQADRNATTGPTDAPTTSATAVGVNDLQQYNIDNHRSLLLAWQEAERRQTELLAALSNSRRCQEGLVHQTPNVNALLNQQLIQQSLRQTISQPVLSHPSTLGLTSGLPFGNTNYSAQQLISVQNQQDRQLWNRMLPNQLLSNDVQGVELHHSSNVGGESYSGQHQQLQYQGLPSFAQQDAVIVPQLLTSASLNQIPLSMTTMHLATTTPKQAPTNYASSAARSMLTSPPIDAAFTIPTRMNESQKTTRIRVVRLSLPTDDLIFSPYQMTIRENLEFFECDARSIHSYRIQGRKTKLFAGQVGVRCIHCSTIPFLQRATASVYFPSRLSGIYQSAQNISVNHLQDGCNNTPKHVRDKLKQNQLHRTSKSSGSGSKKQWVEGIRVLGVVNREAPSDSAPPSRCAKKSTNSQIVKIPSFTTPSESVLSADKINAAGGYGIVFAA